MKAWMYKNSYGKTWATDDVSVSKEWRREGHIVGPVEITEIVEDKVESKEPDWKAMWADLQGVVSKWSDPKYWKLILDEVQRRHTPREKTAEEKLAEVRDEVKKRLDGSTWESARTDLRAILDLCK